MITYLLTYLLEPSLKQNVRPEVIDYARLVYRFFLCAGDEKPERIETVFFSRFVTPFSRNVEILIFFLSQYIAK